MTIAIVGQRISGVTTYVYNDALETQSWNVDHGAQVNGVALDSNLNVITVGNRTSSLTTRKYSDSGGSPIWSVDHGANAQSVTVDSSGNVYVTGGRSGAPGEEKTTFKYNSSGTEQWRVDTGVNLSYGIAVDSSGNVYVGGSFKVKKYNSSGIFQADISTTFSPLDIKVDSSGNIYVCGVRTGGITHEKYNSSGTRLWYADHGGNVNAIAIDSNGNVYIGGAVSSNNTTRKYNSSGTLQWSANHTATVRGICLDASGNVYTVGTYAASSPYSNVRKYDNDGNLIASLTLSGFPVMYGIAWAAGQLVTAIPALALPIALGIPYPTAFNEIPSLALPIALGTPSSTELAPLEYPPTALRTIYRLIISGITSDPIIYRLAGIQCRRRLGESTWMTVEIGVDNAGMETIIASSVGKEMLIELGYEYSDGLKQFGPFLRSTITEYGVTETAIGLSLTLTGRVINPPFTATTRILRNITRIQIDDGRTTVYCAVDPALRPNDTAQYGEESFKVGAISYRIDSTLASMIVTEALS